VTVLNPDDPFGDPFGQFVAFTPRKLPSTQFPLHQAVQVSQYSGAFGAVAVGDIDGDGQQELVAGVAGLDLCHGSCIDVDLLWRGVVVSKLDGTLMAEFPKPIPQWIAENGASGWLGLAAYDDDPRFATPAIADLDGDGLKEVLWVDSNTNLLMVWKVAGTPGPELADWPMYHHDPKHTNVLPVTR
jgi:hypothetical protein